MLDEKGFKEGEAVLRFKSSMKNKNPAMRDFPLQELMKQNIRNREINIVSGL